MRTDALTPADKTKLTEFWRNKMPATLNDHDLMEQRLKPTMSVVLGLNPETIIYRQPGTRTWIVPPLPEAPHRFYTDLKALIEEIGDEVKRHPTDPEWTDVWFRHLFDYVKPRLAPLWTALASDTTRYNSDDRSLLAALGCAAEMAIAEGNGAPALGLGPHYALDIWTLTAYQITDHKYRMPNSAKRHVTAPPRHLERLFKQDLVMDYLCHEPRASQIGTEATFVARMGDIRRASKCIRGGGRF